MRRAIIVEDPVTKEEYIVAREPYWKLVQSIICDCVGPDRGVSQFEQEAGLGASYLSKCLHGKREKHLPFEVMHAMLEYAAPGCDVTIEGLAAANGLVPMSAVLKVLQAALPGYKDVIDLRRKEYQNQENVRFPVPDLDDFDRFLDNLATFVHETDVPPEVMLRAEELFDQRMFVLSLEKWRCHLGADEKTASAVQKGFLEGRSDAQEVFPRPLSDKYKKVVLETLKTMGVI